jgi:1-acyl-sn-glycerol-3-phosphate acyltransferase
MLQAAFKTLQQWRDTDWSEALYQQIITPEIEALVQRNAKPVGSFGYDAWGYNTEAVKLGMAVVGWLYQHYFRVTTSGLEHIPATGRCLIIPNHSGQLPFDGALVGYALNTNPHAPRAARAMIERFFPTVPYVGNVLNAIGGVIGDPANCAKMLEAEEAIVVFPEGARGAGKLYKQRYQLQRFGHGFMHLAQNHKVPIIPCGIVGCEETMPALLNIKPLASVLGLPYVPVAPPLPLPARVHLAFGAPIVFDKPATSEKQVAERVEIVKQAVHTLVQQGLAQRTSVF